MIAELSEELERAKAAAKKVLPEDVQEILREEAEDGREGLEMEEMGENMKEAERFENGENTDA